MQLRDYQTDAITRTLAMWREHTDVLGVAATGAGKTVIFISLLTQVLEAGQRAVVLAHREELIYQPIERLRAVAGDWLMSGTLERPRVGLLLGEQKDYDRQLTIATVQTLGRQAHLDRLLAYGPIDYLITDEAHHCHMPGALINTPNGQKLIEEITIGDSVYGWNGVSFDCYAVDNTFVYWYDGPICEVVTASGRVVRVTPNHKLYSEGRHIYASELQQDQTLSLPAMQLGERQGAGDPAASPLVTSRYATLSRVLHSFAGRRVDLAYYGAQSRADRLSALRAGVWATWDSQTYRGSTWEQSASCARNASARDGEARSEYGLSTSTLQAHDRSQSNGSPRCQSQNDRSYSPASGGRQTQTIRRAAIREWRGADASGARGDAVVSECNLSVRCRSWGWGKTGALQNRSGMAGSKDRPGIRWFVPPATRSAGDGSPEGCAPERNWVDDRSSAESGRALREDRIVAITVRHYTGLVYDFEVRDVHNYVANGVLSSNSVSPTYLRVRDGLKAANPNLRHLGVTATPQRGDGLALANGFTHTAFTVTIADLVRAGYLVKPTWYAISTQISLEGVKTTQGDFQAAQLAGRFDTDACRKIVVAAHKEYAAGRPAIAFTVSVDGAYRLAEAFREAGFSAAAADGTTDKALRRQLLADFQAGKLQVLANCGIWTEGVDLPAISCIHLARPTKSDGLYIQMVGRGLRPVAGKSDCLILDYVPADARNVAMLGDILGCPIPREELLRQFQKTTEPGAVEIGFTFDGDEFSGEGHAAGASFAIIAKELHYLQTSPWIWYRRDGLLTLGCGRGSDGCERILAIRAGQLCGIWREAEQQRDGTWKGRGMWVAGPLAADDPFEVGEALAAKHASQELVSKGRAWHKQPLSEGQERFLSGLARGALRRSEIQALSRGEAAQLISHFQAAQAIARYEAAYESTVVEVVA